MNRIFRTALPLWGFLLLAGCLSGCMSKVTFAEILQLKEGEKLYTKYNLWYADPEDMSCLNIQQGSILPVGTRIIPEDIVGNAIAFKDLHGRRYAIQFDPGYRLCDKRMFVNYTFGQVPPEVLFDGIKPEILARIKRGEIIPGMNRREVVLAYGPPPAIRTPDTKNDTWVYWIGRSQYVRVIFRGDIVRNILNIK